jgi:hypothetical protein
VLTRTRASESGFGDTDSTKAHRSHRNLRPEAAVRLWVVRRFSFPAYVIDLIRGANDTMPISSRTVPYVESSSVGRPAARPTLSPAASDLPR